MPSIPEVPGYLYLGCYADAPSRIIDGALVNSTSMTPAECSNYCNTISTGRFYPLIGLEAGSWCLCGTSFTRNPGESSDSRCRQSCAGNQSQYCGAPWFINVYNATSIPASITPISTATIPPATTSSIIPTSLVSSPRTSPALIGISVVAGVFGLTLLGIVGLWLFKRKRSHEAHNLPPPLVPSEPLGSRIETPGQPKIAELHG